MTGRKSSMSMTEGSIVKNIMIFAIPILLSQIFQNLYNSVDSIVVGRAVGTTALAAVTASSDISHMIVGFFTGLSTGSGVLFSRYFGKKDYESLHRAIHTGITLALIFGLILTVCGIAASSVLLRIVKCPDEVFAEAAVYLRIYLVGVLLTSLYNVGSGVLRSVGDSRSPFVFLVITSCTNIVLDILFVVVLKMGVSGVATATILSQLLSVILVLRKMMSTDDVYKLNLKELAIDKEMFPQILRLGLPAAIQTCLTAFSNLFVQRFTNSFGAAAMAGSGAAKKIDKYVGLISQSFGLSITTFISQNIGAGKKERAFQGIRTVMLMGFISVAICGTPIYFFADKAMTLFSKDPEAIKYGVLLIHIMMPLYYFQTLHQIFSNTVRGFGKSMVAMFTTIGGLIIARQIFLNIAMYTNYTVENVFIAQPFGWICSTIFAATYYMFKIRLPYLKEQKQAKK